MLLTVSKYCFNYLSELLARSSYLELRNSRTYNNVEIPFQGPSTYAGLDYYTKALQHSNVNLSWDDDEPDRAKTLKRKFNADQVKMLSPMEVLNVT